MKEKLNKNNLKQLKNISIFFIIIFSIYYLGKYFIYSFVEMCGERVEFFKDIDFNEEANWLLVNFDEENGTYEVINNKDILLNYSQDFKLVYTDECGGTTPDYSIRLYKNRRLIQEHAYCSWEFSYKFGRLEKYFKKANFKEINPSNFVLSDKIFDSLNNNNNIYIIYPEEKLSKYSRSLSFRVYTKDNGKTLRDQELDIEKNFRLFIQYNNFRFHSAFQYSDTSNGFKTNCHKIEIDCDSTFFKHFDTNTLITNNLFLRISDIDYSIKGNKILYFEWSN